MVILNGSYASPLANAEYPTSLHNVAGGFLFQIYDGFSGFSLITTILLMLVVYDQCKLI